MFNKGDIVYITRNGIFKGIVVATHYLQDELDSRIEVVYWDDIDKQHYTTSRIPWKVFKTLEEARKYLTNI